MFAGCRTNSGVEEARSQVYQRQITNCCVRVSGCVLECLQADGGVERAAGVVFVSTAAPISLLRFVIAP
jgi:hypothetical protein